MSEDDKKQEGRTQLSVGRGPIMGAHGGVIQVREGGSQRMQGYGGLHALGAFTSMSRLAFQNFR